MLFNLASLEGFISHCYCVNGELLLLEEFADAFNETGLVYSKQIEYYITDFDKEGIPTEELNIELVSMLAGKGELSLKELAKQYKTIEEYLEEW